ncbi:MAG: glycosyl transferase family 2 [Micrococcales bacterium]|nr:MAG: glycosyl transferase family 2 [Micrococcales bacterium]
MNQPAHVCAIIPAYNEADRVGATVTAVAGIAAVREVIVIDDGSSDHTAQAALSAGARVIRHRRNHGKAAALTTGAVAATGPLLLFADADLGETAAATEPLLGPVVAGSADMSIALLPAQQTPGGGRGRVVRTARAGIEAATGWRATQPLSGMRCLRRDALADALPLAPGWGVETALTIDLLRAGRTVREVPCQLQHRVSPDTLAGARHRAAQLRDVVAALAARGVARQAVASATTGR